MNYEIQIKCGGFNWRSESVHETLRAANAEFATLKEEIKSEGANAELKIIKYKPEVIRVFSPKGGAK